MAFGRLSGEQIIAPKKKKEPKPKPAPEPAPVRPVSPQPQPVPVRPAAPPPPVSEPAFVPPRPEGNKTVYIADLNILFVARSVDMHREFLSSMEKNLIEMLSGEGLTLYTRDTETINEINAASKRIEQFFWEFSKESWSYPQGTDARKIYQYSISPAGNQSAAVHLAFDCITPQAQSDPGRADAFWLMTDAGLGALNDPPDGYHNFLKDMFSRCSSLNKDKPVVLVQNQIESRGTFRDAAGRISLPANIKKPLNERCAELYSGTASPEAVMIPVQTYGGLVYDGRDENNNPKLALCKNGYFQAYLPLNCQAPCLYTLERIFKSRGLNPFEQSTKGGFTGALGRFYDAKYADRSWRPEKISNT